MSPNAEERAREIVRRHGCDLTGMERDLWEEDVATALREFYEAGERAGVEREREACAREFDALAVDAKAQRPATSGAAAADIFARMAFVIRRRANESEGGTMNGLYDDFIGPCVHGRDPFDRCDICCQLTGAEAKTMRDVLDATESKLSLARAVIEALPRCGFVNCAEVATGMTAHGCLICERHGGAERPLSHRTALLAWKEAGR